MQGLCRLCLKFKELQESHLVPAFAYRIIRKSQGSAPVMLTAKRVGISRGRLRRMNSVGIANNYCVTTAKTGWRSRVFQGAEFPLLNRLKFAMPDWEQPDHTAYSGTACGIDTAKLAHFGAGVLWRASLRRWTIGTTETTTVDLGPYQEPLRKFLLGEASFPADGVAIATICTDFESQGCFFPPCSMRDGVVTGYALLVLGVYFRFFFGPDVPREFRRFCCVQSPRKRIIVADHSKQSQYSYGHLFQTAKESRKLKELAASGK